MMLKTFLMIFYRPLKKWKQILIQQSWNFYVNEITVNKYLNSSKLQQIFVENENESEWQKFLSVCFEVFIVCFLCHASIARSVIEKFFLPVLSSWKAWERSSYCDWGSITNSIKPPWTLGPTRSCKPNENIQSV